jgi:hypothetical protein
MPLFSQTTQEVLANLAGQIAERRARVEALSDQVQQTRDEYNERVRSLSTQIADVEVQINREELRLDQIEQDLDAARQAIAEAQGSVADVEPMVATILTQLRTYITNALPFQTEDRLAEVSNLETLLADGSLEPQTIVTRTWNTVEAEFRLTQESGLFRQTILVGGERQLAEVARLGMVMLYFRTFDEQFGYAVPDGSGGWDYAIAPTREERDSIENLFDSLRRNLREGFFTLPNPYDGGVR